MGHQALAPSATPPGSLTFALSSHGHTISTRRVAASDAADNLLRLELDDAAFSLTAAEADALGANLRHHASQMRQARPCAAAAPVTRGTLLAALHQAASRQIQCARLAEWMAYLGWDAEQVEPEPVPLSAEYLAELAMLGGQSAELLRQAACGIEMMQGDTLPPALLLRHAARLLGRTA